MADAYQLLLEAPAEKLQGETFNIGNENLSIAGIAERVGRVVQEEFPEKGEIEVHNEPSDDRRSYHINSDKIRRVLGFQPRRTVEDAVRDLCDAFRHGLLPDSTEADRYYNVRSLQRLRAE